ncbi:MAG: hypothetical protein AAB225_25945 [Acidobacteriota bacterium]
MAPGFGLAQRALDFEGRYWVTDSTQAIKVTDNGKGTDINFKTDLGFVDKNFPEARLTYHGKGRSKLKVGFVQARYDGDRNVQKTIDFGGTTYTFGTRVVSSLKLQDLKLGWAYQFVRLAGGKLRLGSFLQGHVLWFRAGLAAPNLRPPLAESERGVVPIPMVGISLDAVPHSRVNISGDFSGLKFGKYGSAVDGELAVKLLPIRRLGFTAGYRSFRLGPKFDPDYAVVRISGLFVGAFARLGSAE